MAVLRCIIDAQGSPAAAPLPQMGDASDDPDEQQDDDDDDDDDAIFSITTNGRCQCCDEDEG